ncbi:uncharacterized protein LOC128132363 [Lactuca sativa]|uniref:uncharacterized protein LOC128132363 n=1 Tax=Lactuca sativa TaxID=4236 RepID=UPI0022AF6DA1|nr:uncharacterized protein LOC128132363 [Lactuca sativa]
MIRNEDVEELKEVGLVLYKSKLVRVPYRPFLPKLNVCMLGDAQHVEEAQKIGLRYMDVEGLKKLNKIHFLLLDHSGLLHLLVISHEKEKVTELKIEFLGETSTASTISYLDNAFVHVGSSYGDSQIAGIVLISIEVNDCSE